MRINLYSLRLEQRNLFVVAKFSGILVDPVVPVYVISSYEGMVFLLNWKLVQTLMSDLTLVTKLHKAIAINHPRQNLILQTEHCFEYKVVNVTWIQKLSLASFFTIWVESQKFLHFASSKMILENWIKQGNFLDKN